MKAFLLSLLACAIASVSAWAAPVRVLVFTAKTEAATQSGKDLAATITHGGAQAKIAPAAFDATLLEEADVVVLLGATNGVPRAALEKFAQRGGGLVMLGASLETGAWLKPLVGGAWTEQSRKFASLMMLFPLTDAHAITREASSFDITDDTFYDLDLDPAINVLGSAFTPKVTGKKKDDRAPERLNRANVYDIQPQMWTYEGADKHRAFVLLQGDAESLKHASIRTFILRGIAWASRRANVDELCREDDLATLRYPAGGPRRAEDTVKAFEMLPGFKATAIASEPLINKPIAMQFDGKGRLWIAETPEYPNGRRPLTDVAWKETGVLKPGDYDRPATDRISILSEPDASGKFTQKTIFYRGLELVTGFCLYRDGVIAVGQPDIVFIHGEGAAQRIERLFTGFTPGDTHFVANHLMVAPDGWIYANTGSGPDAQSVAHPEVKAKLSSGVFRFKPDGTAIEQVGSKGGNAFGLDLTSEGEIIAGQATSGNPVQHVVLPEWILAKGKVGSAGSMESVIKGRKVVREDMPTRVPYMQIDVVGGYSSATASTVYEGGAWPAQWNRTVFCTEPILDIIHCEKLLPAAPNIVSEMTIPDREWLRSRDFWFFPVDVQFGPDGAMYVLDFYNPIVAHSDTRGPKHSRAGASVRPDREHYFGRIYRIQNDEAKQLETLDLTAMNATSLVKAFTHPNKGVRFNAQRLLVDRDDAASALPELKAMAGAEKFAPARILALWSLERLGKLESPILQAALKSEDADVRKSALLIVEALGEKNTTDISALLNDPDSRVRLLALRAMASSPLTTDAAASLLAVLPKLDDDWSRSAATAAASSNAGPVLEAALAAQGAPSDALIDLASSLSAALAEKQDGAALAKVIVAAAKAASESAPLVRAVLEAAGAKIPPAPKDATGLDAALKSLLVSPDQTVSASALPFAAAWDADGSLKSVVAKRVADFLALAADAKQSDATRACAVRGLVNARQADARIVASIVDLLKTKLSDGLVVEVVAALASTGDPALGQPLVAVLPNLPALGQTALFDALTTRAEWANAVLDALQNKELKPALLGPSRLSKLRLHPDPAVAKRAIKIINEVGAGTNAAKDETIAKLLPLIESKAGDAAKGKVAFTATCSICHKFNGDGKEVGPVLDGIGVQGTNELLISIIDPSRVVDNEHRTWSIALKNGTFAVGIIARENENSLTLHLPGGAAQDIKIADIKSRQDTGLSLMPEGLEALGADTLRDILAYLRGSSGKFRAINLGTSFTTDTGAGLYASREAKDDTIQPVKYGIVNVEGVPFSLPDPSTTPTGGNVIVLKNADGNSYASTLPQRVEIPVGFAAGNLHFLGGIAGWGGGPDVHKPAMKVTIAYADGKEQIEELFNGDVFIDYPSGDEVPGSKRANGIVQKHHVRYFSLPVNERAPIKSIVLESYKNGISPTTLAITADTDAPKARPKFLPSAAESTHALLRAADATGGTIPFQPVEYRVQLDVVSEGYDGKFCWFHPRAGAIPGPAPTIVLTMQRWRLAASDVFYPVSSQWTRDLGKTWSSVVEHTTTLGRHPLPNGNVEGICDFTPKWHAQSGKLLGTGQTVQYDEQDKLVKVRPRSAVWSIYDPEPQTWSPWAVLKMPDEPRFNSAGAGSTQRVDLENGDVLLPIYSKEMNDKAYSTTVVRCTFDGKTLTCAEQGNELSVDIERGLYEPSLARFHGKYFLTMRNDRAAYVAASKDGLHYDAPRKWTFDDGADLGSYNTQAHWLTHRDGLFLTYTRKGANNDNVVRHRAPLFLAQIDPERLVVIRSTEREIVPNKGAQLGNFAVVDVNENETWVTTSEGMSPGEPQKFGANGRVYAARIQWAKPNTTWDRH